MARVIILSEKFPSYHPKSGELTHFPEKFLCSIYGSEYKPPVLLSSTMPSQTHNYNSKHHTIRNGNRWKTGDIFTPRVWSGRPYKSKQIILCDDIEIKTVYDFEIRKREKKEFANIYIDGILATPIKIEQVAKNDGLTYKELLDWFKYPAPFKGQIICWSDKVKY